MAVQVQVTFDAGDAQALGRFWVVVLGYVPQPPPEGHPSWDSFLASVGVPPGAWHDTFAAIDPDGVGPRLLFQRVPEGKTAKNRVHLDVNVGAGLEAPERLAVVRARAAELVALGASQLQVVEGEEGPDSLWIVMADPEGNEFCLQ
ncbi:VOC family protein [Cellulomonas sp. URHE0023]|uniref:VOC family protein n=1 Tax=Cellulomonas sp. URHE0023 TaxID=1380354 RepID=UPI0004899EBF|nr:VOC family protein [Cellulomonas sp. URHE0023]